MSAALPTPIDCCQQNNCSSSTSGGGSGAAQWNITNVNPPAIGQGGTSFTGWINFVNGGVWVYNGVSFIPLIL